MCELKKLQKVHFVLIVPLNIIVTSLLQKWVWICGQAVNDLTKMLVPVASCPRSSSYTGATELMQSTTSQVLAKYDKKHQFLPILIMGRAWE